MMTGRQLVVGKFFRLIDLIIIWRLIVNWHQGQVEWGIVDHIGAIPVDTRIFGILKLSNWFKWGFF